jgi:hypothetical protein
MQSNLPTPAGAPWDRVRGVLRRLSDLPVWAEVVVWAFLVTVTVGMRLYLIHLLPIGLWSKDAGSYAYSAFRWLHTGIWETDPRRGPIYSMLIALCGKLWGSISSLMILQHAMGVIAILLSVLVLRLLHGRRALIPLAACGYAYGVYGLPLYLEHLVRNETVLFFCGTVSLATWFFAIRRRQPHWLWITGIAAAILTATKNVWLPFPLVFAVATLWYFRKEMRLAVTQVLIFAVAFTVPYMGAKVFKHRTLGVDRSDEPQDGVLLYGRTAQFTYLDGGIEPDIKIQIRDQVLAYQHEVFGDGSKPPHLNNNEILKVTVVPHLNAMLRKEGKTGDDLNALCRALAIEAIRTHPLQYARQVWRDMVHMHLTGGVRYVAPDDSEPETQRELLEELPTPDPMIRAPEALAKLDQITGQTAADDQGQAPTKKEMRQASKGRFNTYRRLLLSAWLFDLAPVLLTSLLLPVVFFLSPLPTRAWWLGSAGIWYFTVVLLSTVGRPLDRYLIPALPVMFFTLSSALMLAWNALAGSPGSPEGLPEISRGRQPPV